MSSKKKRFLKLYKSPKETSFYKIKAILGDFGYRIDRIKGSHFHFRAPGEMGISVPIHNGRVKKRYVEKIIKTLKEMFHEKM